MSQISAFYFSRDNKSNVNLFHLLVVNKHFCCSFFRFVDAKGKSLKRGILWRCRWGRTRHFVFVSFLSLFDQKTLMQTLPWFLPARNPCVLSWCPAVYKLQFNKQNLPRSQKSDYFVVTITSLVLFFRSDESKKKNQQSTCRAFLSMSFDAWKKNRCKVECSSDESLRYLSLPCYSYGIHIPKCVHSGPFFVPTCGTTRFSNVVPTCSMAPLSLLLLGIEVVLFFIQCRSVRTLLSQVPRKEQMYMILTDPSKHTMPKKEPCSLSSQGNQRHGEFSCASRELEFTKHGLH